GIERLSEGSGETERATHAGWARVGVMSEAGASAIERPLPPGTSHWIVMRTCRPVMPVPASFQSSTTLVPALRWVPYEHRPYQVPSGREGGRIRTLQRVVTNQTWCRRDCRPLVLQLRGGAPKCRARLDRKDMRVVWRARRS